MKTKLIGQFKKIIYSSNNFFVVNFKIASNQKEQKEILKIGESLNNINLILDNNDFEIKISYEVEIEAKPSKKYGISYFVVNKTIFIKDDKDSIIQYLSSSLFKGINIKIATKLVENLGTNFIHEPGKFKNKIIELIGEKRGITFFDELNQQTSYQNLYKDFIKYELSISILNLINAVFEKNNIKEFIKNNLYKIMDYFPLIDYFEIDKIAKHFYVNYDENVADENLIIWIIYQLENNLGSTIIEIEKIFIQVRKYKSIDIKKFKELLKSLILKNKIILHESKSEISSMLIYEKEMFIALKLLNLTKNEKKFNELDINYCGYNLDDVQKQALKNSLENSISIITGGPGTGKTFLINLILKNLKTQSKVPIELLAPTGKAAIQISYYTNHATKTIHSFLKYNEYFFEINKNNPLATEILIIDEFSMIDVHLFYSLLIALPNLKKIIIVGDENQLPSIGPGYILNDLINSRMFSTIYLKKIYRQNEGSLIAKNSALINQGEFPSFDNKESKLIEFDNHYDVKEIVQTYIQNYLNYNVNLIEQQILIPQYKNINGIDEINLLVQELVNINQNVLFETNGKKYYKNDKIIQLENDNDKNVFNGEIGYIQDVIFSNNKQVEKVIIKFSNKNITYTLTEFNSSTKLAYAISVHKFQGSECKDVLIILTTAKLNFISKKLFYTAYTRATNTVHIISKKEIILEIIANDYDSNRKCNLLQIIAENKYN